MEHQSAPTVVNFHTVLLDFLGVAEDGQEDGVFAVVVRGKGVGQVEDIRVGLLNRGGVGFDAIEGERQDDRAVATETVVEVLGVSAFFRVRYAVPDEALAGKFLDFHHIGLEYGEIHRDLALTAHCTDSLGEGSVQDAGSLLGGQQKPVAVVGSPLAYRVVLGLRFVGDYGHSY